MENNNIVLTIGETINDLHKKINEIKSIPDNGSSKIVSIKDKTIDVLNNVLSKLDDNKQLDKDELDKVIRTVSDKSRQLYENALDRIKVLNDELSVNNNQDFEKQSEIKDELSNKAVEILNEWLKKEGE